MKQKILILGGTEFVGRQLVERLILDKSKEVFLFNRGKTNPNLFPTATQITGDRETSDIEKINTHKWDYIIDFSSYFPKSLQATLEQINRDVKNYIYISTISVYDLKEYDSTFEIDEDFKKVVCSAEEAVDTTMKTYGKKKVACEAVLEAADWLAKTILRPSIIYGKYDPTDRLYYWLRKLKFRDQIIVPDAGKHKLSLTFADDLVDIILAGIDGRLPTGVYNCSTHAPLEVRSMLEMMQTLLDRKCEFVEKETKWLMQQGARLPLSFGGNLMISNAKIKQAGNLNFTSFEDSLKAVIDYYQRKNWYNCKAGIDDALEDEIMNR